jgi:DNA-binding MarR family transcriptional regulator
MITPQPTTIAFWTALVSANRHLIETIETALKAEGMPPLAWYDALLEIEKTGSDGIRPFALEDRLLLPQYGTSRLLDRITKAGLIERTACADDGRGQVVRITDAGKRMRRSMWPIYADLLTKLIEWKLPRDEMAGLLASLQRLRNG